jgi:hypothetical protein
MKRVLPAVVVVLAAAAVLAPAAMGDANAGAESSTVSVENLTPSGPGAPGSQPLSPPLFVVHSSRADVWSVGAAASDGVAALAEDADNSVLTAALDGAPGVRSVETGAGGPIPSGASRSYTIRTRGPHNRLTLLTMLVNTNDAFTGLDSALVHGQGATYGMVAYDAGSEINNELKAFIPGPCCGNPFVRAPEGGVITMHRGITGVGELDPAIYGWPLDRPVARITLERD